PPQSLIKDLEEAEEQHARALRSHLHNIDRLLELQRRRLRCLQEGYDAQLEALQTEFEEERRLILEQHERESCCLQDIMLATEQNYTKKEEEVTMNFQSAQADMKNKSLWDTEYSRLQLSGKVEGLWEQLQRAVQSYTEATEHQKITFEVLKQKDKKSSREIKMQMKKLQKLQDLVTATKGQLVAHRRENEERNRQAREEKEKLMRQLQELESSMSQARMKARGDLAKLTVQSNATLKALVKVVEKQAMQDYVGLERFWQRFNKVKLEEQALERAREVLRERNRRLRGVLRRCLEGFSVHQEVL
ncbi:PREDICTED: coiled-coil domain-containing protein 65, partial [Merops nubicus]|uniref:coiled-coil domain-containing protein 65 n=1 Tax=Merops nubicus TaxID=57421 RepID=UPI0004F0B45A